MSNEPTKPQDGQTPQDTPGGEMCQAPSHETAAETAADLTPQTDALPDEAAADETDPGQQEPRVFGMPRPVFLGIAVGFGLGMIAAGVFRVDRATIPCIIGAGAGYLLMTWLHKRGARKHNDS